MRAPNGIRTRAAALKGRSPRPLDDGGFTGTASPWLVAVGTGQAYCVGPVSAKPVRMAAQRACVTCKQLIMVTV